MTEKPAQLVVAETQAALESAQAALAEEERARIAAETELTRLLNDSESKLGQVISMDARLAELEATNLELEAQLESYRMVVPFRWAAAAVVAALLGGFFLGLWSLDAYVRHRHGGFRVY